MAEENALVIPPNEMLEAFENINVAAPMVRYSKLPFRRLVSQYDCHITHTPMILAAEFSRSANARATDFSTSKLERGTFDLVEHWPSKLALLEDPSEPSIPRKNSKRVRGALIAQFAAHESRSFADAVELIRPYVDGVDLNCGCPQSWAYKEQLGCWLLRQPEHVAEIVKTAKNRVDSSFPISIKIRGDGDQKRTEQLIQTAIHAQVSHITVHGRTRHQSSTEPVSLSSIAFAVSVANGAIPMVANGDAWGTTEVEKIREETGCRGVMSARGLLANPALFSGYAKTPKRTIEEFVRYSGEHGMLFPIFHRHLSFMLESHFARAERVYFNALSSYASVIDHLETRGLNFRKIA